MTRKSFEVALQKGAVGEAIIRQHLEAKGWVVYQPITEGAHCFDMLGIFQKKSAVAFDVKAKARMNKYPCTGVNQTHFEEYQRFSERHAMPFWIVFVDEGMREIYGNTIQELERPRSIAGIDYPWQMRARSGKVLRLWPLAAMKRIAVLSDDYASALSALNQRSYEYGATA